MRAVTLPPWVIEALAALQPGEEMLVVIPVETPRGSFPLPCPLGAVGERVAVTTKRHLNQARIYVSLAAKPEAKKVGEIGWQEVLSATGQRGHMGDFAHQWCLDHGKASWPDAWAWFCRVRRA